MSPLSDQRLLAAGGAFAVVVDRRVVRVTGDDRLRWLNDLSSQALLDLAPGVSTETLFLSPKGRIEHAAGVIDDGSATWLLVQSVDDDCSLAEWLQAMRFRRRVEVEDVTDRFSLLEFTNPARPEGVAGSPSVVEVLRLSAGHDGLLWNDPWPGVAAGGTRYGPPTEEHPGREFHWQIAVVDRERLADVTADLEAAGLSQVGADAAEALRVAAWRPAVAELDDRSLPHELDWLRTAVHLRKGCYRGQETVAHVHNLGHPPRRLTFLHLDGSGHELPAVGAPVHDPSGSVVGTLTSVALHYEAGPIALALLKRPTDPALPLTVVTCDADPIAATQQAIVAPEGVTPDRPAPRGPLTRGLMGPGRQMVGAKHGVRITRTANG